jgi:limonene-1,2-epoxide hydrolase
MNNPNWVIDLFNSIDTKNTDKFVTYLTEDAIFSFGNSPSVEGNSNIHAAVGGFFESIKDIKHTNLQTIISEGFIVVRGSSTYTRHNDTLLTVPFCNVFDMQGEKIKNYRIYIDLSQLYI